MAESEKRVYISHADADWKTADILRGWLSTQGFSVFHDRRDILPGENWGLAMGQALENSDAMVVLISPASVSSSLVRNEINYALGSERFRDRFIPVEIESAPDAPWILREMNVIEAKVHETKNLSEFLNHVTSALQKSFKPRKWNESTASGK